VARPGSRVRARQDVAEHPAFANGMSTTPGESPEDTVPWVNAVFEQPWWLEAVAPGRWDAWSCADSDVAPPAMHRRRFGR
jgi:hypothetical protein